MDFLRWIFYAAAKQAKLSGKMSKDSFRKDLSMPGLLREMRECFDRVPDLIVSRGITLSDLDGWTCNVQPKDSIDAKVRPIGSLGREYRTGQKPQVAVRREAAPLRHMVTGTP